MVAILSENTPPAILDGLEKRGYSLLLLPPHPFLQTPVASHADMLLFFGTNCILTTKTYYELAAKQLDEISIIAKKPVVFTEKEVTPDYPSDILLNCAEVGQYLFCKKDATAASILSQPKTVCNVPQGYAKCSVVPVGSDALITQDPSILGCARQNGFDVLSVVPDSILLQGYGHGLIGGCASYAPYRPDFSDILFTGSLESFPEGKRISSFCFNHGKSPISLADIPLTDVGTVFLL